MYNVFGIIYIIAKLFVMVRGPKVEYTDCRVRWCLESKHGGVDVWSVCVVCYSLLSLSAVFSQCTNKILFDLFECHCICLWVKVPSNHNLAMLLVYRLWSSLWWLHMCTCVLPTCQLVIVDYQWTIMICTSSHFDVFSCLNCPMPQA